jgi:hypothetical protein
MKIRKEDDCKMRVAIDDVEKMEEISVGRWEDR